MVSFSPNTQSYIFNHMSFFVDYNDLDCKKEMCLNKKSIYGFISGNPEFSKFKKIIDKSQMAGFLDDMQSNCTLLIPSNYYLKNYSMEMLNDMDEGDARNIVSCSTIPKILARDLITSSPVCYLYTKNPRMRMYVTNINGVTNINKCAKIIRYDIWCDNGIIHVIDRLLSPNQEHFLN